MRLNVHGDDAERLLRALNFRFTPTFILLDGTGNEVWRANGTIVPDVVDAQLAALC